MEKKEFYFYPDAAGKLRPVITLRKFDLVYRGFKGPVNVLCYDIKLLVKVDTAEKAWKVWRDGSESSDGLTKLCEKAGLM